MPRPVVIIPDTTPLIHLAAGELLHLLPAMGRVVVPDVVALEATRLPDKPWAREVALWFAAAAVEVVETEMGPLYRLALRNGLRPPRGAGEISIIQWLRAGLAASGGAALVVFEDVRFPRMLAVEAFPDEVVAVTTRSFLEVAEARGLIPSAEAAFRAIEQRVPTASPASFRSPGNRP